MSTIPTDMGSLDINGPAAKDEGGRDMYTGFEDVSVTGNKESSIFGFAGNDTELSLAGNAHSGSNCLKLKGLKIIEDKCCVKISSERMKGAKGISMWVKIPQYFFGYLNAVNNTLPDYSIDSSNASYYTHEKSRIVAVELHYY